MWFKNDRDKIFVLSLHKSGTHLIESILNNMGLKSKFVGKNVSLEEFYSNKNREVEHLISHYTPPLEMHKCNIDEVISNALKKH